MAGPGQMENRLRNRSRDALFAEGDFTRAGGYQTNELAPYLYKLAGIDAETDPASKQAAHDAADRYAAAQGDASAKDQAFIDARQAFRTTKRSKKYKGKQKDVRAARKAKKGAKVARVMSRQQLDAAASANDAAAANANRITKLTPTGRLGDENDQAIDDLLTGRVRSALEKGTSDDPRLNRQLGEEEARVREQLRRAYGSDYENTTAGNIALANFQQRRSESLADFARRDVTEYEPMRLNQRRTLGDIAGIMQNLALRPVAQQYGAAGAYGAYAKDMGGLLDRLQHDRTAQFEAGAVRGKAQYDAEQANDARLQAAIGQIGSAASGVSGVYASGAMGSGMPADNTYPTGQGVTIGAKWGDRVGSMFGSGQSPYTAGY